MSDPALVLTRPAPSIGVSVGAACFGFALVQLDVTIINVALPSVGRDLGMGTAGLQWVVDAYALVFAALLLPAGYLSDVIGARRVYRSGLGLFAVTSLLCGLAPSGTALILARAGQGLAAAAMLPSSLSLLNHACGDDPRRRGWAVGWWTSSASVALASGPVIGGILVHLVGWRWIFLVNLPLCLLGLAMVRRLPDPALAPRGRFDIAGQLTGAVALAALTGSVIEAGPRGITDPIVLALAAGALAGAALFVLIERRTADPMLSGRIFAAPIVGLSLLFGMVVNLAYYGILFVLSLYLQRVIGLDPVHAGLAFLPLTVTFLAVNALGSRAAGRSGPRRPMIAGALVAAAGYALLLPVGAAAPLWAMLPAFVLIPAGMGYAVPAMITGVLAGVDRALSGTVAAALNAARQAGGVVGVALFGALSERAGNGGLHAAAGTAAVGMALMAALAALVLRSRPP